MAQEDFKLFLDFLEHPYEERDGWIIVGGDEEGYFYLPTLENLPDNVQFNNRNHVHLDALESLPDGVVFENGGHVHLDALESLPDGVVFENGGDVYLNSLKTLPEGFVFRNAGNVYMYTEFGVKNQEDGDKIVFINGFEDFTPFHDILIG